MRKKRLPAMRYPMTIEQQYTVELRRVVRSLRHLCEEHLFDQLNSWVEGTKNTVFVQDAAGDDWKAELEAELQRILKGMKKPTKEAIDSLNEYADDVDENSKKNWKKIIRQAYGVQPTAGDQARYDKIMKEWSQENANLITNISQKATNQIRDDVTTALTEGTSVKDLKSIIHERIDVSDSRAELIARDQIGKLNGDLNKERQEQSHVEQYIWRTVGDERVRATHVDCDGEIFSWDSIYSVNGVSKPDGNDPGHDYQCRCWAEPILPSKMEFEIELAA